MDVDEISHIMKNTSKENDVNKIKTFDTNLRGLKKKGKGKIHHT